MKQLRKAIFWAHLLTGVTGALVILLMSATGVLLTYQRQITAWADTRGLDVRPPSAAARPLPAAVLLERVAESVPDEPTSVKWYADAHAPAEIAYGRARTLFVHPYTGAVLGEGSERVRELFRDLVSWHRWFAAEGESREAARAITGASNLGFLFLVLSGFYLWWPRNGTRKAIRNVTLFRSGLKGKARDFNWHNVVGFWSALPLLVVVSSGVVISYPWASDLVYRAVGEEPPARGRGAGGGRSTPPAGEMASGVLRNPVALQAAAEGRVEGWRSITLQLPADGEEPVAFVIDQGDGGQPQLRATLALDRETGEVVRWEPFAAQSSGRQLRSILRFAHTGEVAGLLGQTLAGLVSAGAALLVWTGLALTWRRFRSWRRRGAEPARRHASRARQKAVA